MDLVVAISASVVTIVAVLGIIIVAIKANQETVNVEVTAGVGPSNVNTGSGSVVGEVVEGDKFVIGDAVGRDKIINIGANDPPATLLTALPVPRDGRVIASRSTVQRATLLASIGFAADFVALMSLFGTDAHAWRILSGIVLLGFSAFLVFRYNLAGRSVVPIRLPRTENWTRSFYQLTRDGLVRVDLAIECPACEQEKLAPPKLVIGKVVTSTRLGQPSEAKFGTDMPHGEEDVREDRLLCPRFPKNHHWRLGEPR